MESPEKDDLWDDRIKKELVTFPEGEFSFVPSGLNEKIFYCRLILIIPITFVTNRN
jgi:hypothetical protein